MIDHPYSSIADEPDVMVPVFTEVFYGCGVEDGGKPWGGYESVGGRCIFIYAFFGGDYDVVIDAADIIIQVRW